MSEKPIEEKKNDSFDNLLDELENMGANSPQNVQDEIIGDIENELQKSVSDDMGIKTVTENGMTFVDVTAQFVKEPEKYADQETQTASKKKVRTFNEIFSDFFEKFIPKKEDKTREKVRKVVMDVSLVTIIGCVIAFGVLLTQHFIQVGRADEIKNLLLSTDDMGSEQYDEAWEELFRKYPTVDFPQGMNLKYAYLYAVNPELVGWVSIDKTNLDVQVVQTKDNTKYLNTDFYGKKSRYGCPYVDYRNDAKYLDDNTIIYGHHMSDGLIFSNLDKYKTLDGYKESPLIKYDTIYQTYYFKVIGAFVTNSLAEDDNGYLFNYTVTDFASDSQFMNYIDEVHKRSIFTTDVNVLPDDKLLTLSTCSYEFGKARLVVVARMVRENEDNFVDITRAEINPSPRYPQAWYDAKNMTNPYANDENWEP